MLKVNVNAVIYGTQLAMKEFKESNKKGVVVNTASGAAYFAQPHIPVYAASKAAVFQFCASIGQLDPNVRVHSVCPGFVDTPLANASISGPYSERFVNPKFIARSKELLPDDIADAMMYAIDNDDLEPGAAIQAFREGLEVLLPAKPPTVRKIKDIREREARLAKM